MQNWISDSGPSEGTPASLWDSAGGPASRRTQRRSRREASEVGRDELLSSFAHDINTALGIVMNCAALAARDLRRLDGDPSGIAEVAADLERIQDAATSAAQMVRQYLVDVEASPTVGEVTTDPAVEPVAERSAMKIASRSGLGVLVVDDDEGTRSSLSRVLRRDGFQVDTAAGGGEALELLRARRHVVLLTDNRMPGLSGTALVERALTAYPLLRVLVMSGGRLDRHGSWLENRTVTVLEKPFAEQDLLGAVRAAVRAAEGDVAGSAGVDHG